MAPIPGDSSKTPVWHVDAARGPSTPSLDHLVGAGEKCRRNFEAKQPRSLQVDDELEFGRLHDRQVGGLPALEYAAGVDADLTIHVHTIGVVAHQPAGFDSLARGIARGNPITRRECRKLDAPSYRIPASYASREAVEAGGLMGYDTDRV